MMACTLPFSTVRSRPLRIFRPSTSACRFLISSRGINVCSFNLSIVVPAERPKRESRDPYSPPWLWIPGRAATRLARDDSNSPHRPFQTDRDQLLRLDREFHRQLLQHVLDEAVDHQRHRFFLGEAALHAVEQRVLGTL